MAKIVRREPQDEPEYVLHLNKEEAEAIQMVIGRLGGVGRIKRIIEDVYFLLESEGICTWPKYHDHIAGQLTTTD